MDDILINDKKNLHEENEVAILNAEYKVTCDNFVSYNILLANESLRKGKISTTRNLILVTVFEIIYYFVIIKNKIINFNSGDGKYMIWVFVILWSWLFLCFIFSNIIAKYWLKISSRKLYLKDEYSRSNVKLELSENCITEQVEKSCKVNLTDIIWCLENNDIYAIYSKKNKTLIIPKTLDTELVVKKIDSILQKNNIKKNFTEKQETHINIFEDAYTEEN